MCNVKAPETDYTSGWKGAGVPCACAIVNCAHVHPHLAAKMTDVIQSNSDASQQC